MLRGSFLPGWSSEWTEHWRCRALLAIAECEAAEGDVDRARRTTLTVVDTARHAGDDELFAVAVLGLSRCSQENLEGDLAEVERETADSGDLMSRWRAAAWRALLTIVGGDVDGGSLLSAAGLRLWGPAPNATAVRTWGGHQLTALAGDLDEADAEVRRFMTDPGLDRWRIDASWLCGATCLADAIALTDNV